MVQPKDPPLSVRLPKPLRERVEEWATERGIKRNAAVVQLIERGLEPAAEPVRPKLTPAPAKPAAKPEPAPAPKLSLSLPANSKLRDPNR